MQKNIVKLEVQLEGKQYIFLCDNDSPLTHIREVLLQYQKHIDQIEDQVRQENEKKASAEVTPLEDTTGEVENVG